VLRWFFVDGISGLASRVWAAYQDESIERDILRYLYLVAEPLMGGCVADALYPLEEGMLIPPNYFDQYSVNGWVESHRPKSEPAQNELDEARIPDTGTWQIR